MSDYRKYHHHFPLINDEGIQDTDHMEVEMQTDEQQPPPDLGSQTLLSLLQQDTGTNNEQKIQQTGELVGENLNNNMEEGTGKGLIKREGSAEAAASNQPEFHGPDSGAPVAKRQKSSAMEETQSLAALHYRPGPGYVTAAGSKLISLAPNIAPSSGVRSETLETPLGPIEVIVMGGNSYPANGLSFRASLTESLKRSNGEPLVTPDQTFGFCPNGPHLRTFNLVFFWPTRCPVCGAEMVKYPDGQ